jgi:hypothetical protein
MTQGLTTNDVTENSATTQSSSSNEIERDCDAQHCGLLIYISFATTADMLSCINAAETCLNVPILTSGLWGDGSSQQYSIRSHLTHADSSKRKNTSVTIVPQANLICKVKSQGTSIQYHSQIDKDKAEHCTIFLCFI